MVPELRNQQRISNHFVDDAVLIVDAPRPIARERMPQGFWLTNATEGITLNLTDQTINPLQQFAVAALPVEVVLPGFGGKNQEHRLRV